MKTATEQYITLKRFDHLGCVVIPKQLISEGVLNCYVVKCTHGAKEIAITRKDI